VNPHDLFFKETFSDPEVVRDFLQHYLAPEIAELLDLSEIEQVDVSFVDPELREYLGDLMFRVRRKDGRHVYVYILFEHKSYPDKWVPLQTLGYVVRVYEYMVRQGVELCPVVAVVVYHGREPWTVPVSFREFLGLADDDVLAPFQPDMRYYLCDLSKLPDEELRGGAWVQAVVRTLKYVFRAELKEEVWRILELLAQLSQRENGLQYVKAVLWYLCASTDQIQPEDLRKALDATFPKEGDTLMPTIAEQWIKEGEKRGLQRGLQRGREEGLREGEVEGLLNGVEAALEIRYGKQGLSLFPEIKQRADTEMLKAIIEAVRQGRSLDELRQTYVNN